MTHQRMKEIRDYSRTNRPTTEGSKEYIQILLIEELLVEAARLKRIIKKVKQRQEHLNEFIRDSGLLA